MQDLDAPSLIDEAKLRSIELLHANTTPFGVRAAGRSERAHARGYEAIFARDAAICGLGMLRSGDADLARTAATSMRTLAHHQAANGQIPKLVDPHARDADFWYLGCIDATLWWLISLCELDRHPASRGILDEQRARVERAVAWLMAQEHQRLYLLQQNEASDWADIMPRSGFVLYSNALWYLVKRWLDLPRAADTYESANVLLHPFGETSSQDRRTRLLADYPRETAKRRELYLSFVNFSFFGDEGDVFGNLLAVLCGLAEPARRARILDALLLENVHEPWPVRSVCEPIREDDPLWRHYMRRHDQNHPWQYHNGGIWPMLGGFWVAALVADGRRDLARTELCKLARAAALNDWEWNEWLHSRTHVPLGMPRQSWNAAAWWIACHAVETGAPLWET